MDIVTAYLYAPLDCEVFMNQPEEYDDGSGKVLPLKKGLYGLKQAGMLWHTMIKDNLVKTGYQQNIHDPGLYTLVEEGFESYIIVYVDDILIAGRDVATVIETKRRLQTSFEARDLGEAETYLGINITRDRESRTLKIDQERMIKEIVAKFGQEEAKTRATPLSTSIKLAKDEGEPLDTACYPSAQLVGSLMYLAVCTRTDISYAVGALARYMVNPTLVHWKKAIGVVRYLAGITYDAPDRLVVEPRLPTAWQRGTTGARERFAEAMCAAYGVAPGAPRRALVAWWLEAVRPATSDRQACSVKLGRPAAGRG